MKDSLWRATATELGQVFRSGQARPSDALAAVLARIEAVNGSLNAIVTLDLPGARAAAATADQRWQAGTPLSPLDGVPLTVKDNLFVAGLRATWGSLLFADHVAPQDDLPVARLRAAGAIILGKTNTPELALSGYTDNRVFGATGNPWAPALSPGGSSGGAVASVAAGFGPLAIATDAGGSIRRPSAHAGVAGLKPGLGRVPRRHGFPPLAQDLQVIGCIARGIADLRLAFSLMATPAPAQAAPRRLRIGVIGALPGVPIEPAILTAFETACGALRALGHGLEEIVCPWQQEEVNGLFANLAAAGVARVMAGRPDWRSLVTPAIAAQADAGASRSAVELVRDLDAVTAFRWRMADVLAQWDLLVTPASPVLAWPKQDAGPAMVAGQPAGPRTAAAYSTAINIAGLPALVVPLPVAAGILPAGLQIIGPLGAEEALLDLGAAYEAACPWPQLAPI